MKLPNNYTEEEKQIFNKFQSKFKSIPLENANTNELSVYLSFCSYCNQLNFHSVKISDLGDKITQLQCKFCKKEYKIRPSPFMCESEDLGELDKKQESF